MGPGADLQALGAAGADGNLRGGGEHFVVIADDDRTPMATDLHA